MTLKGDFFRWQAKSARGKLIRYSCIDLRKAAMAMTRFRGNGSIVCWCPGLFLISMLDCSVNRARLSEPTTFVSSKTEFSPSCGKGSASVNVLLQCTNLGGMEKVAYNLLDKLRRRDITFKI